MEEIDNIIDFDRLSIIDNIIDLVKVWFHRHFYQISRGLRTYRTDGIWIQKINYFVSLPKLESFSCSKFHSFNKSLVTKQRWRSDIHRRWMVSFFKSLQRMIWWSVRIRIWSGIHGGFNYPPIDYPAVDLGHLQSYGGSAVSVF